VRTPPIQWHNLPAIALGLPVWLLLCSGYLFGQSAPAADLSALTSSPQSAVIDAKSAGDNSRTDDRLPVTPSKATDSQTRGAPQSGSTGNAQVAGRAIITAVQNAQPQHQSTTSEPANYDLTRIGPKNVGRGLNYYSLEREIALGRELADQVEQSTKLVTDPVVTSYVKRIGQNLVHYSDSRVPFTIKVIDSDEINAFALPGGFFYVNSGLILAADSEAELAALMAHEIAHVAARHATRNLTRQQTWNAVSNSLLFIGGPAGFAIAEIASIAGPMNFLKFSRDAEREADRLGLQYEYAAGYDPQALIQFFERLQAQKKEKHNKVARMFSTHPMTAARITSAQAEIRTCFPERDSYIVDTSEFAAMKARLIALQGNRYLDPGIGIDRPVLRKHMEDDTSGALASPSGQRTTAHPD
jgi:beta-barrel assembly-enhancing protease